jgi:hypothetical protein
VKSQFRGVAWTLSVAVKPFVVKLPWSCCEKVWPFESGPNVAVAVN